MLLELPQLLLGAEKVDQPLTRIPTLLKTPTEVCDTAAFLKPGNLEPTSGFPGHYSCFASFTILLHCPHHDQARHAWAASIPSYDNDELVVTLSGYPKAVEAVQEGLATVTTSSSLCLMLSCCVWLSHMTGLCPLCGISSSSYFTAIHFFNLKACNEAKPSTALRSELGLYFYFWHLAGKRQNSKLCLKVILQN
jgi:hypothetical protein